MPEQMIIGVCGLWGSGYALHLLWERWLILKARRSIVRWLIDDPTPEELDDILRDPEHLAFLLGEFTTQLASQDRQQEGNQ